MLQEPPHAYDNSGPQFQPPQGRTAFDRQRYSVAESKSGSDGFFNKYLKDFEGLATDLTQSHPRSRGGSRQLEAGEEPMIASYKKNDRSGGPAGAQSAFPYHDGGTMRTILRDQEHKLTVNGSMLKQAQDQCFYYQNISKATRPL